MTGQEMKFAALCGEIREVLVPGIRQLLRAHESTEEVVAALATVFFNEAIRHCVSHGMTHEQIVEIVSEHIADVMAENKAANLWPVVSSAEDNRSRRVRRPNR